MSTATPILRAATRNQSTLWLQGVLSAEGRQGAIGWYDEGSTVPHVTGARCIAIVRAELLRRGFRTKSPAAEAPKTKSEAFLAWWEEVNGFLALAGFPAMTFGDARTYRDQGLTALQAAERLAAVHKEG